LSPMVLRLLMTRLSVALPTPSSPMRKYNAPAGAVGRRLDLVGRAVCGFPVEDDLAHALRRAEVDSQPLRVARGGGPAGAGITVDGGGGGGTGVLGGGGGRGPAQCGVVGAATGAGGAAVAVLPCDRRAPAAWATVSGAVIPGAAADTPTLRGGIAAAGLRHPNCVIRRVLVMTSSRPPTRAHRARIWWMTLDAWVGRRTPPR
jgi:hypothetical protein